MIKTFGEWLEMIRIGVSWESIPWDVKNALCDQELVYALDCDTEVQLTKKARQIMEEHVLETVWRKRNT